MVKIVELERDAGPSACSMFGTGSEVEESEPDSEVQTGSATSKAKSKAKAKAKSSPTRGRASSLAVRARTRARAVARACQAASRLPAGVGLLPHAAVAGVRGLPPVARQNRKLANISKRTVAQGQFRIQPNALRKPAR